MYMVDITTTNWKRRNEGENGTMPKGIMNQGDKEEGEDYVIQNKF